MHESLFRAIHCLSTSYPRPKATLAKRKRCRGVYPLTRLSIIGCGYVGAVTAACFAKLGHLIDCIDTDAARVERLRRGISPVFEHGLDELLAEGVNSGLLTFSDSYPDRINAEIAERVPHIARCDTIVATNGKRVDVVLDLHLEPGADLAHTANVACAHAHALVEQEMGIELASPPRATLHYRELRLSGEKVATGWERPPEHAEEERDERGQSDTPEEAQA